MSGSGGLGPSDARVAGVRSTGSGHGGLCGWRVGVAVQGGRVEVLGQHVAPPHGVVAVCSGRVVKACRGNTRYDAAHAVELPSTYAEPRIPRSNVQFDPEGQSRENPDASPNVPARIACPRCTSSSPTAGECQWQPKTAHFWQSKIAHFGPAAQAP